VLKVELPGLDAQQVPGSASDESRLVCGRRAQHLPEARDMVPQRVVGGVQALVCEELAEQALPRDSAIRAQEQQSEQCALLRAAERDRGAVQSNGKRPEYPKLETDGWHLR
jgi:hypothetical protein